MKKTTATDDDALLGRVRETLDASVAALDPAARERLLRARRRALAVDAARPPLRRWPLWAAASAAALVLAVGVVWQQPAETAGGGTALALAEDPVLFEWLLGEAAIDPAADADFYAWLDEAERGSEGRAGDAG